MDNTELINKAHELRAHGLTTGEIADELNVSIDTARWLTLQQSADTKKEDVPVDFAVNWNSLGGSSTRLKYVSAALSDMALTEGEADVILGIAVSGIPFATMMADYYSYEMGYDTALAVFHPQKTKIENEDFADNAGTISTNFASVEGKRVVVVDDVITSGKTMDEVIKTIKDLGGEPIAVAVLIDKAGFDYIDGVPVKSLISVSRLG
ncbi:orotate phosphoribosyltransferase-like protein [Methanobrevibacter wolinii]|uniref:orotate phosphoribosyltransferase-like protein n=1 Tax=Methanobrevibacter wolinii TaxID=190977 RepID=UPI0005B2E06A|nr:orotate phosphoribosyltransferase-like protein [Methanobrevibacter wolinii]MDD5959574.1 orotate phosphoribosyltransferase-like protein [Methanobrevibacter wolinii]